MNQVWYRGRFVDADAPVHPSADRAFRYGDGLFETLVMQEGKIHFGRLHRERFESAMTVLDLQYPAHYSWQWLMEQAKELVSRNHPTAVSTGLFRIRLSLSRGSGGLNDDPGEAGILLESWPLDLPADGWNQNGLVLGLYPHGRKSTDLFSALKTANFLPYVMAARYAREQHWNDAVVLNHHERVADTSIANLFVLQGDYLLTPPLSEGCVNGVMRRLLLEVLPASGIRVEERPLSPGDLQQSQEILLTNVVRGIRWVREFDQGSYAPFMAQRISTIIARVRPQFME